MSFASQAGQCTGVRTESTSYSAITGRLRIGRNVLRVELHFIADDLDEHAWYVDLAADMIEQFELYLRYVAAETADVEEL